MHVVDQVRARVVLAEALHHQPRPRLQVAGWGGFLHQHIMLCTCSKFDLKAGISRDVP